jgi:hypothetical protein
VIDLTLNMRQGILSLFITLSFISPVPVFSDSNSESFDFSGRYRSSSWSSDSSSFAVLWEDPDSRTIISVIEKWTAFLSDPILLPAHFDIRAFDWSADSSGFVLKVFAQGVTELMYIDRKGNILLHPGEDGFQTMYPTDGLFINEAGFLALTLSGEGHPDVYVYKNNERVFSTDVYPGVIHCAGWKDGYLYCVSDMDLSQGLNVKERRINRADSPESEQMYKIDIHNISAVKSSLSFDDLHFLSPDNKLFAELNNISSKRFILNLEIAGYH